MKLQFNYKSLLIAIMLLIIELFIEKTSGFIRYTMGDFLVVILLFYLLKTFIKTSTETLCYFVFFIAYGLESLQAIPYLQLLNLNDNQATRIILGTTFTFSDLIAYTLGLILVYYTEQFISSSQIKKNRNY